MDTPRLRPLTVGEVVDVAIKIYRSHFLTLVKIVSVVVAPASFLGAFITAGTPEIFADPMIIDDPTARLELDVEALAAFFVAIGLAAILSFIASMLATAASFKAISSAYLGERSDWIESLTYAVRRLHSLAWLSVLSTAVMLIGLVALLVPGIWLFVAWSVATPVLLFEGHRGRRALGRSFRLVRHRWWPTAAALLLAYILVWIVQGVIAGALVGTIFAGIDQNPVLGPLINGLASTVAAALTTPFVAAVVAVIYFDLRVRKEGFDIELLAREFGTPTDAGSGSDPGASPGAPDPGTWSS